MFSGEGGVSTAGFDAHRRSGPRAPIVPSGVFAMLIFVATEIMFFAGVISAFLISKAGAIAWPPPDQPRLPVTMTAVNTAALLASGVLLALACGSFGARPARSRVVGLLWGTAGLGAFFVGLQGYEWVRLIRFGLTLTSSAYGAFFYLIVGTHALHAVGALLAVGWIALRLRRDTLTREALSAVAIFWYFVVGVWPLLYVLVYLL